MDFKSSLKIIYLQVCRATGRAERARVGRADRLIILAYHGVDPFHDPVWNHDFLQLSSRLFERHLAFLVSHYQPVSLLQVVKAWGEGEGLPDRTVAVTFDDGYLNNLEQAAPLLRKYRVPATMFCTTAFIDGTLVPWWYRVRGIFRETKNRNPAWPVGAAAYDPSVQGRGAAARAWEEALKNLDHESRELRIQELAEELETEVPDSPYPFMTWEQVRQIQEFGVDVAPHTVRHVSLGAESAEVVRREIKESIRVFSEELGVRPILYSYPYGQPEHRSEEVVQVLKSEGIELAVTTQHGYNTSSDPRLELKRMNVGGHSVLELEAMMAGYGR